MTQEEIKYHNQLWYYKTYNQLIDKCIQLESDGLSRRYVYRGSPYIT